MPKVKPVSFQISEPLTQKGLILGSSQELEKKAAEYQLPQQQYQIYAPVIGFNRLIIGASANIELYRLKLTNVLKIILSGQFDTEKKFIRDTIETTYEVATTVIYQLYFNLSKTHTPWEVNKTKILTQYKDLFCQLEAFGAEWVSLRLKNKNVFEDLTRYVFNADSLTKALGDAEIGGDLGFSKFKELVNIYLPMGANINASMGCNPDFGTFLHYSLAFEIPYPVELIQFIESKRNIKAHTQFNYATKDGYGRTPLIIALLTRQEKAVFELIALNKKGINIGINIVDNNGCSPLLFAAALGMDKVVAELLKQGANPLIKDKNGLNLSDYAQLKDEKIVELVSPLLSAERSSAVNHSYLYYNDIWSTPLCFYEDDEQEKTGDEQIQHFIVLSPLSPHKEKQEKLISYLNEEVKQGKEDAKNLLSFVTHQLSRITETTFSKVCLSGQELVRAYLSSHEVNESIRLYKEKQLRCACALSQLELIETLLKEGVNPNATDALQRTALHYAVMRSELVLREMVLEATDRGCESSEDALSEQAELASQQHPLVIELLQNNSKIALNYTAHNKAGNTAEAILLREKNSNKHVDAQSASKCLEKINKALLSYLSQNHLPQGSEGSMRFGLSQ